MPASRSPYYSTVAITLHWLTALAILTLLVAGLWMTDAIKQPDTKNFAYKVYQWHKALGLTVMVLTVLRLAWRIANPPPALPAGMTAFERWAAGATHVLFYGLLLGIPLAGWAMVSASPLGFPTIIFGLFEWPHIAPLTTIENKPPVEAALKLTHKYMGFALMGLLALHIAAALKHHFVNRDNVLARMIPGVRSKSESVRPKSKVA